MWRGAPLVPIPSCPRADYVVWGERGGESVNAEDATPVLGGALEEPELTHTWGWVGLGRAFPWGVTSKCE